MSTSIDLLRRKAQETVTYIEGDLCRASGTALRLLDDARLQLTGLDSPGSREAGLEVDAAMASVSSVFYGALTDITRQLDELRTALSR